MRSIVEDVGEIWKILAGVVLEIVADGDVVIELDLESRIDEDVFASFPVEGGGHTRRHLKGF